MGEFWSTTMQPPEPVLSRAEWQRVYAAFPDSRAASVPIREERALEDTPRCAGCGQPFWPAPHREHKSYRVHGETHCRYCRNALLAAENRARWTDAQDIH